MKKKNILMIGMPASGKSTIGVLLAKRLGYSFVDVDLVIQEKTGKLLKEIIEEEGSQTGQEGCLSVPGKAGIVTRPQKVKVKALDENMEEFVLEGEDLLARAICHECAHLHGQLYVSLVEGELMDTTEEVEE